MPPKNKYTLLPIAAAIFVMVHSTVNASGDSPLQQPTALVRLGEIVNAYHDVVRADMKCSEARQQLATDTADAVLQLQQSGNASWLELQHAKVRAAVAENRRQNLFEVSAWLETQSKQTVDSRACITSSAVIFTLPESSVPIAWVSIRRGTGERPDSSIVTAASKTFHSATDHLTTRDGNVDSIRRPSNSSVSDTRHSELVTAEANWLLRHHEAINSFNRVKASALLSITENAEHSQVGQQSNISESARTEFHIADVNQRLLHCVSAEATQETNGSIEAYHRWISDHAESMQALHSKGLISKVSLFQSRRNVADMSAFMFGREELGTLKQQWLHMQYNSLNVEPIPLAADSDGKYEDFAETLPNLNGFRNLAVLELLFDSIGEVVSLEMQKCEVQEQLAIHSELLERLRYQSHPNHGEIAICSRMVEALAQQSKDIRNKLGTLSQLSQVLPLVDRLADATDNLQLVNSMTLEVLLRAEELNISRLANQPFERELKTLQNKVVALRELQKQGFASKMELFNAEHKTVALQKKRTESAAMQRYHQARLDLISQLNLKLAVP